MSYAITRAKLTNSFTRIDVRAIRACHSTKLVSGRKINEDVQLGKLRAMFDVQPEKPQQSSMHARVLQWAGIASIIAMANALFLL